LHLELVHYASIGGSANQISPLSIRTQNEAIRRAQESESTAHRNAAPRNTYTDPGRTARRAGPWGSLVYPWWFGTTRLRFKSGRTHLQSGSEPISTLPEKPICQEQTSRTS